MKPDSVLVKVRKLVMSARSKAKCCASPPACASTPPAHPAISPLFQCCHPIHRGFPGCFCLNTRAALQLAPHFSCMQFSQPCCPFFRATRGPEDALYSTAGELTTVSSPAPCHVVYHGENCFGLGQARWCFCALTFPLSQTFLMC